MVRRQNRSGSSVFSRMISSLSSGRRSVSRRRGTENRWQIGRSAEVQTLEDRLLLTIDFQFIHPGSIGAGGEGFDHETEGQARRDALELAGQRLGGIFSETATITLFVTSIEDANDSTLASAGSEYSNTVVDGFAGNEVIRTKILTGTDTNGGSADGTVEVNWGQPFEISADPADVDGNEFDFVSTMYHELLHAVGFASTLPEDGRDLRNNDTSGGGTGAWGFFDQFITDVSENPIIDGTTFSLDATAFNTGKVGGASPGAGLFFNGTNARDANGGAPVGLYTPTTFESGSSVSHLDDENAAFSGLLMLAATDTGASARNVSTLERAILSDLGYNLVAGGLTVTQTGSATTVSENATTDTFDVALTSAPLVDVVLNITSGDTDEATVDLATLTFTPENWNQPQTVTVTGVDDGDSDGHQTTLITISVDDAISDDGFDAAADATVSVTTLDNEPIILTTNGTAGNDNIVLDLTGLGAGNVQGVGPTNSFTGIDGFVFDGTGGDDTLTINLNGNAIPSSGIVFHGGAGGNDKLVVVGSDSEVTVYTPDATQFGDGVVTVDGVTITFTGLEPVDISNMASATLNLPGDDDVLTVEPGTDFLTGSTQALRVSGSSGGTSIEAVSFFNNAAVVIDTTADDGDDMITVIGGANAHGNGALTVNTGSFSDSIDIQGDVTTTGTQTYSGPVVLSSDAALTSSAGDVQLTGSVDLGSNTLTHSAAGAASSLSNVSDSGGLTFSGAGRTNLFTANTYTGVTDIAAGEVWTNNADGLGATGAASGTAVASGAELYLAGNATYAEELALAGILAVGTSSSSVWSGPITLSGSMAEFELDQPSDQLTVSGPIGGSSGFTKSGPGTLILSSDSNTFAGNAVLAAGTTVVSGTTTSDSAFFIQDGATLSGAGSIGGAVTVQSGGILSPGSGVGTINTAAFDLQSGATLNVEVNGVTTAGTDYDQLVTSGTVTLAGTLNLVDGFAGTGTAGDMLLLIDNNSPDPVVGTFTGLPNGSDVSFNGEVWRIVYDGGDGNDVVLINGPANLSIADVSANETDSGQTVFTFTVTVDSAISEAFTVPFSVTQQTATESEDYVVTSGTLNFVGTTSGETQTLAVSVNGDLQIESDETFLVILGSIGGSTKVAVGDGEATGTIVNDDFPVPVNLSVDFNTRAEAGPTVVTLTATAEADVFGDQTLEFTVTGSGVEETDYTLSATQITIPDGQRTATATFTVLNDDLVELNETATISLANPSTGVSLGATPSQDVTITDNDVANITIADVTLDEGDSGDTTYVFTVSLSKAVDTVVSVDFETEDGTGTVADGDYDANTGNSLTFMANSGGAQTQTIAVVVKGDEIVEQNESFLVNLLSVNSSGRNVIITDNQASGTITNDDTATLSIDDVSVVEGDTGTVMATFTVTLDSAVDEAFTVNYSTVDGTATAADGDFTAVSNNVITFAGNAGETRTLQIAVAGDTIAEVDETFVVKLSNVSAGNRDILLSDDEGQATIIDDDGIPVQISADITSGAEADSTVITITATADSPVSGDQTVEIAVSGTGVTQDDYTLNLATITISSGQTEGTATFTVANDDVVELTETATITLRNPSAGVRLGATTSVDIDITDNDSATLSAADVTLLETNSGETMAVFAVVLNNAVDSSFTVDFATANATATTADGDYVAKSDTLTFSGTAGETQTVGVIVNGDTKVELDETFVLNLSGVVAGGRDVTIADSQAEATIQNDDAARLLVNDVSMAEGNAATTTFTFTVTLDAAVDSPVTVDVDTADGTADAGDDYVANTGNTLSFSGTEGETQTVQVTVNGDTTPEMDETFFLNLTNLTNGGRNVTIGDTQAVGTILDDDGIKVNLGLSASAGTEAGSTVITIAATSLMALPEEETVQIMVTGTGVTSGDYTLSTTTITIPAGQAVGLATFTVIDDLLAEDTEIATISLHSPSIGISLGDVRSLPITIADNDAASLSISDVTMEEGTSGTETTFVFTVTLNGGTGDPFTVDYTTSDGTATAGNDYTSANGTLTFTGTDQETQTIAVTVAADATIESDEDFAVVMSNIVPTGPVITFAKAEATGTIVNDDKLEVNLAIDETTVNEASGTIVTLTASVATPVVGNQTVAIQVSGVGIGASDYTLSALTITIPNGQTSGSATFKANIDGLLEPAEVATVSIANPSSGLVLGTTISHDVVIVDHTTVLLNSPGTFPGNQPTLTWQNVPNAVSYEIWFSRIFPAQTRLYSVDDLTINEWTPPDSLGPAFYRYWVRAYDANGVGSLWSDSKSFEVQPTLVSPLTPTFSKRPTFEWDAIPFATSYTVFVRTSTGDIVTHNVAETNWTPSADLPEGNIRWWIRATEATGNRGWSAAGTTNVDSRTTVLSPSGGISTGTPLITWQPVIGAGRYILHVQNLDTDTVAIREDRVLTTSYTPTTPLAAGNYRVWVKAIDASTDLFGSGRWSSGLDFQVILTHSDLREEVTPPVIQLAVLPNVLKSSEVVDAKPEIPRTAKELPVESDEAQQPPTPVPTVSLPVADEESQPLEFSLLDAVMTQLPLAFDHAL